MSIRLGSTRIAGRVATMVYGVQNFVWVKKLRFRCNKDGHRMTHKIHGLSKDAVQDQRYYLPTCPVCDRTGLNIDNQLGCFSVVFKVDLGVKVDRQLIISQELINAEQRLRLTDNL